MLILDFETRSPTPISCGAAKYAEQAEVICLAYCFGPGPVEIWKAMEGEKFPPSLTAYIMSGKDVVAHNAEFEHAIFSACLPHEAPDANQWVCSATLAAAQGLPRGLDALARCLGLPTQKQAEGKALIQELCVPPFSHDTGRMALLYDYCMQDVDVTRQAVACLRPFTDDERDDFHVNLLINGRGIHVDLHLADLASRYAGEEVASLTRRIQSASQGDLTKKSGSTLTRWVYDRLGAELQELMHKNGEDQKVTLDKRVRAELLAAEHPLAEDVHEVIRCADLAGRSSVAKYKTMLARAQADDRVRGCYVMNGAAQTGRYSAHGLQMHNLPRVSHDDPEYIIGQMEMCMLIDPCMETLSSMLRPAICASEDKQLVWGDWSAIEGRVLPWLANTPRAEEKLQLYRNGQDVYVHTAAAMMGCDTADVDADLRQTGKVAELALGYAGGAGALHSMGRNYGRVFTPESAEQIKSQWRTNNQWAVDYWDKLDRAANTAFMHPGTLVEAGRVAYIYTPEALMGALWCKLPSGRLLCYPGVKRMLEPTPWGEEYQLSAIKGNLKPKAGEREWPRTKLWKGLLAENVTQACAADILRESLRAAVLDHDLPVIGHTHDEIILETRQYRGTGTLKAIMESPPEWATGLPLDVKMGSGERYGK